VDLQEKRQLDLSRQVARVKARARPWRSIIALILAVIVAVISASAGGKFSGWGEPGHLAAQVLTASAAAAFCLLSEIAVIGLSGRARDVLQPVTGSAHAAVVRSTIVLAGSVGVLIITLALVKVPVGKLVLGGAATTILIGIAAQQSLSNVFAGIVLLLSHPFDVGDAVRFRSGALGGQIEGTVTEIGITYVCVETGDGIVHLPNSQVLAAAVGPIRLPPPPSSPV
jgi:small-conductance mechanosensitive channel